jgi:putative membrane protein
MGFHPVYGHYGAGDVLWSIISTALFIGLLVAAIMLLVRVFSGPRQPGVGPAGRPVGAPPWYGPGPGSESGVQPGPVGAERILAERYARGEISEEEYQGRLEVLRRAASGWAMPQGPYPAQPEPPRPQPRVQPESQAQAQSPAPQPVQPSAGA